MKLLEFKCTDWMSAVCVCVVFVKQKLIDPSNTIPIVLQISRVIGIFCKMFANYLPRKKLIDLRLSIDN